MSLYLGTNLISGTATNTISNAHSLLDFKWSDHILNDVSWLRADTFSWQDGTVYSDAYNHLVNDYNTATAQWTTETIGSYTIWYREANDGHKIIFPESETTAANIYNESGVAWYYILDTENQRFKLPRTKWNFVGLRDGVGKYVPESLPKPKLIMRTDASSSTDADLDIIYGNDGYTATTPSLTGASDEYMHRTYTDTSDNLKYMDIIGNSYQDNAPVQQRATQMYLYFYVGQFSQRATEQTAGLNSELFNGKVDLNLNNMNPSATAKQTIVGWGMPDYESGVAISSGFTATKKGIVYCYGYYGGNGGSGGGGYGWCKVGNSPTFIVAGGINSTEGKPRSTLPIYIDVGESCTFGVINEGNGSGSVTATFYPLKGV